MKKEYETNTNHLFSKCLLNLIIKIQSCKKQTFVHACFEHALIETKITKSAHHIILYLECYLNNINSLTPGAQDTT